MQNGDDVPHQIPGIINLAFWQHVHIYEIEAEGKVKVKVTLVQALRLCTGRTAHRGVEE
jgi:hypothetical protein